MPQILIGYGIPITDYRLPKNRDFHHKYERAKIATPLSLVEAILRGCILKTSLTHLYKSDNRRCIQRLSKNINASARS